MGADSIHESQVGIARTRGYRVAMRRLLPLLGVLALACVCASATHAARGGVPQLLFPVVGTVDYEDDFGDPRGALRHEGNDLLGDKRAPVVAVEEGTVKYWTTSSSAGCMLYLYGVSGTMYEYIHLNNDLTAKNDNKGKCVKGVAYAVADGTHVEAGQQIGYLGDSGDANGIHPHLHFEVHPKGKAAVDPFPFLKKAAHLLDNRTAGGIVVHAEADRHARLDRRRHADPHRADDRGVAVAREADEGQPRARVDPRRRNGRRRGASPARS